MLSIPNPARAWRASAWAMFALAISLVLCTSAFFYNGQKVDESEIVINAVAIAAGGWSPEWSGYGHLGMYIAAAALVLASVLLQVAGVASSYADGIYLLFQDEAAYRITRIVYTLADVLTALLLAKLIVKVTGQRLVAVLFFATFLLSANTWVYANYIRSDSLVSFFIALAVYALAMGRARMTPFVVGIAIGAAIACKYSALVYLPLAAALAIDEPGKPRGWKQRLQMVAVGVAVAVVAAFALQPRYNFVGMLSAAGNHLSGSHFTPEAHSFGDRLARLGSLAIDVEPLVVLFGVTMWFALLRVHRSAGLLLAVLLGIAPFAVSNFAREYWLLPFADAVRAAGWLGIACLVQVARSRVGADHQKWVTSVLLLFGLAILWCGARDLAGSRGGQVRMTNREAAKQWLYVNAANRIPMVYSYEKNYVLPRAYAFDDYQGAAHFSRVFIFKRNRFESLHALFKRRFYQDEFRSFSEATRSPPLRISMGSGTAGRLRGKLLLCAGKTCYKPQSSICDAGQSGVMGKCVTYSWDMDKPSLKTDLRNLKLRVGAPISAYAMCWYTCGEDGVPMSRKKLSGEVGLASLGGHLFASTRLLPFDAIAEPDKLAAGELLVTSPTAYVPWLKKTGAFKGGKQSPAKVLAKRLGLEPVQEFRRDQGPVIEVYRKKPAASIETADGDVPGGG